MMTINDIKTANTAFDSIPFENLIGAPLCACVNAQKQAAEATINYIQEMGFEKKKNSTDLSVIMVSFEFVQDGIPKKLQLPLLSIVPVPYLQIDTVDIKFTAEVAANSDDTFNARISNQRYEEDTKGTKSLDYKGLIDLNIRATGTNMPAGLAKIFQVFEGYCFQIEEKPIVLYYLKVMERPSNKTKLNTLVNMVMYTKPDLAEEAIRYAFENLGVLCSHITLEEADNLNDVIERDGGKVRLGEVANAYYVQLIGDDITKPKLAKITAKIKAERPELDEKDIVEAINEKLVICQYLTLEEAERLNDVIEKAGGKAKLGLIIDR